jgi:REP element-mobilizing transposase RayT
MTNARSEVVDESAPGIYHCWSRCVRRAFLCGWDSYLKKDFDYRKDWIVERIEILAGAFGLDVFSYAVLDNHLHLVVRNRPDLGQQWTDKEVARRWLKVYPRRLDKNGKPAKPTGAEVRELAGDWGKIEVLRTRLSSISWFMKCLKENIAVRANREDEVTGRFWEGRFHCQRLLEERAVVACMSYVDLNSIRAEIVDRIQRAEFTSAFVRFGAELSRRRVRELKKKRKKEGFTFSDRQRKTLVKETQRAKADRWLARLEGESSPFETLTLEGYLNLLDWTGREIQQRKKGVISKKAPPLLEELEMDPEHWAQIVGKFGSLFFRMVGGVDSMVEAAKNAGKKWFKGLGLCREFFPERSCEL